MAFKVKDHAGVVSYNIAQLEHNKSSLKAYKPSSMKLMIASIGRDNGIFQLGPLTFKGLIPTMIKSKDLLIPRFRKMLGHDENEGFAFLKPALVLFGLFVGYLGYLFLSKSA
jgi:hypothetical protein